MGKKHMKKMSSFRSATRYHFILFIMVIVKKIENRKYC